MDKPTVAGLGPLPPRAKIVVIGAGIVGNCLVAHLAELGWDELVLIDKGRYPIRAAPRPRVELHFPTDHNREIAMLTLESQRQYEELA